MKKPSTPIIFVAVLASLLEIIDASIVNVALPTMMGNLGATLEDISMVVTGYAIANAIVLPVSAWLGERIGRRKYYLGCIAAFTLTSVACGLAPNLMTLTFFRILQGLMGGALLPTSQTLIYEQFPKEKAGIAGAIFGMSVMIGPTLGPVLGGYLTDEFGWRSIFNINLPLGILALLVGSAVIFDREKQKDELLAVHQNGEKSFDAVGLLLLVLGVGCLQFVLERGEADDWFSSYFIVMATLTAVLSLPLFVWWELKVKNPIIDVRLFKDGTVVNGVLLMASVGFFLYSVVFILPVFMGRSFHYTATQIGLFFIPGSLLTAMMMPMIGKLMQAGKNPKVLIAIGLISIEVCLLLMTQFSPQSSSHDILMMLFVRGFAMAFLFVPINSSILSQFSGSQLGQVSGLMNLFRQIGGSMGVALVATLLATQSKQNALDLTNHLSALRPPAQAFYQQSSQSLQSKMQSEVGLVQDQRTSLQLLQYRIQNQVFVMSFIQLSFIIMIIFGFSALPLYFLKFRRKPMAVMDSH